MSIDDEVSQLQRSPIFANVERSRLKLLALNAESALFSAGDAIIQMGGPPDAIYVVLTGKVGIPNGDIEIGHLVGLVGGLLRRPHAVSVHAQTAVHALRLPISVFMELMEHCPQTALAVMRELARRLNDAMRVALAVEVTS
ncbi:cyclic nucleotide-binding domain-containing protein [Rhabdaerophilum sp. SD176]|uniref:cyclic nucleotide-binding domain-containing protein n=1 Tax=Rhabdaerophilum sp. SD176 TaxID=2983548 RepID=UPI0024E036D7|nr:cyclic nucleotide-binding domain-containing protein [Rhabdaerophilum sp. SD176]